MKLFAQLAKYDETTGYFEATAADESLDKANEIFDYATSKPFFQAWSDTVHKASGGKSSGNVRAMHGKVAAGKLTEITFDDEAKAIKIAGLVVDPVEKTKMATGVYTGVSIGGKYIGATWDDPVIKGAKRYTADPSEISIVDYPCNGSAFFTVVKDGGDEELRKFVVAPITDTPVEKGMGHVAQLASLLQSIGYLTQDQYNEASYEGDGSQVPAALEEWLKTGAALLCSMTVEETAELAAESTDPQAEDVPDVMEMAAGDELDKADDAGDLEKAGAKHSKATIDHHDQIAKHAQGILDHVSAMAGQVPKEDGEAAKAADDGLAKGADDLAKVAADRDAALAKADALAAELVALKATPAPVKAAALAVSKSDDGAAPDPIADLRKQVEELPDGEDKVRAMIKLAHQSPR
jgi:hypothetical protein